MKTNPRLTLGLASAVVLAVAGPTFLAVGSHSANQSGNDPVAGDGSVVVERRADAAWRELGGTRRFSIEVRETTAIDVEAGTVEQAAARSVAGEAIARSEVCDEHDVCVLEHEWRGSIGSPVTEGSVLAMDPGMQAARFTGWLRHGVTGRSCRFAVLWDAGASEPAAEPASAGSLDLHEVGGVVPGMFLEPPYVHVPDVTATGEAGVEGTRDGIATVEARCWTLDMDAVLTGGAGALGQDVSFAVEVATRDLSTEHVAG